MVRDGGVRAGSATVIGKRVLRGAFLVLTGLALTNCAQNTAPSRVSKSREIGAFSDSSKYGKASPRVVADGGEVPKGGGRYHVGKAYSVAGRTFVPRENPSGYSVSGMASWYGEAFHGRRTSNGEVYDRFSISAAHPTMPLPSYARVTNLRNNHSIVVRVNDRGPFHGGRVMDVSERTAIALAFKGQGTTRVSVEYLGKAALAGSDDGKLLASLRTDGNSASAPWLTTTGPVQVASVAPVTELPRARFTPLPAEPVVSTASAPSVAPAARATLVADRPLPPVAPLKAAPGTPRPPERPFDLETIAGAGEPQRAAPANVAVSVPAGRVAVASGAERASFTPVPVARPQRLSFASETGALASFTANHPLAATTFAKAQAVSLGALPKAADVAPAIAVEPAPTAGGFVVMLGAFAELRNVEALRRALAPEFPVTFRALGASRLTAVSVGPFETRVEAEAAQRRARAAGASEARIGGGGRVAAR